MGARGKGGAKIVDTNVPVIANGGQKQASLDCEMACIEALLELKDRGHLVLDDADLIYDEYRRHLSLSGQPNPGDEFMKWVNDVRHTASRCSRVRLTQRGASSTDFEEFPDSPELRGFDPSDRKFVAVALAHGDGASVQVAVDRGWWMHRKALNRWSVQLEFLCPDDMKRAAKQGA